ncbi:BNR-4 repeat-containing protein [Planctomycetota bacterium]
MSKSTIQKHRFQFLLIFLWLTASIYGQEKNQISRPAAVVTLNQKADGYRGIWYMNQPSQDEYVYKYSGGLGTYCAKHKPFAVYCRQVDKTFFCYGGTTADSNRKLIHMVSYFDHETHMVPRPTILLDKKTDDAHDNPVISVDDMGHIWIFSTSHGRSRPSYIHKSKKPYNIDEFALIPATRREDNKDIPITNFSYMQSWYVAGKGFICFFTKYNYPAARTNCFMTSPDGVRWSPWTRLAAIEEGHYQISAAQGNKAGATFNYHPQGKGLNWRTNLYYMETADFGQTWRSADGVLLSLPLTGPNNPALVHNYQNRGLYIYLKDIRYDQQGYPVILYITSKGYQSGPQNDPRTWTTARWTGARWEIRPAMVSDNNYDMGSLYLESEAVWRIIAPTRTGPQPYNPGGEMVLWLSADQGKTWKFTSQLTTHSPQNHTYARCPVNAHPDFYALWADGHGRKPSVSNLYFCDKTGKVYLLPRKMDTDFAHPKLVKLY